MDEASSDGTTARHWALGHKRDPELQYRTRRETLVGVSEELDRLHGPSV